MIDPGAGPSLQRASVSTRRPMPDGGFIVPRRLPRGQKKLAQPRYDPARFLRRNVHPEQRTKVCNWTRDRSAGRHARRGSILPLPGSPGSLPAGKSDVSFRSVPRSNRASWGARCRRCPSVNRLRITPLYRFVQVYRHSRHP